MSDFRCGRRSNALEFTLPVKSFRKEGVLRDIQLPKIHGRTWRRTDVASFVAKNSKGYAPVKRMCSPFSLVFVAPKTQRIQYVTSHIAVRNVTVKKTSAYQILQQNHQISVVTNSRTYIEKFERPTHFCVKPSHIPHSERRKKTNYLG